MFAFSGFYLKLENQLFKFLMAYNLEEKIEVRIVYYTSLITFLSYTREIIAHWENKLDVWHIY